MNWKRRVAAALLALGAVAGDAWAVVGRPMTPVSYAGVARRTTRRTTGMPAYPGAAVAGVAVAGAAVVAGATVASLPAGCNYSGTVYHCGSAAYRPVYDGPEVVYVAQ
ncbi:MAG TPA: hypothetical protein VIG99_25850 [Myxococcaceae bacterium]|jgi:hypothetical protein